MEVQERGLDQINLLAAASAAVSRGGACNHIAVLQKGLPALYTRGKRDRTETCFGVFSFHMSIAAAVEQILRGSVASEQSVRVWGRKRRYCCSAAEDAGAVRFFPSSDFVG